MFAKMRPSFDLIDQDAKGATRVKLFFELVAQDAQVYCGGKRPSILFYIVALLGSTRSLRCFSIDLIRRCMTRAFRGLCWQS
jgi:hypothetical protein